MVRSLSADNLLNGRPFYEAQLHAGDLLTLGPLTFEVQEESSRSLSATGRTRPRRAEAIDRSFREPAHWEQEKQSLEAELADRRTRFVEAELQLVEAAQSLDQLTAAYEQTRDRLEESEVRCAQMQARLRELEPLEVAHQRLRERLQEFEELEGVLSQLRTRLQELEPLEVAYQRSRERLQELEATHERTQNRLHELQEALEREQQERAADQERRRLAENAWAVLRDQVADLLEQRADEPEVAANHTRNGENAGSESEPSGQDVGWKPEPIDAEISPTVESDEQFAEAIERLDRLGVWRADGDSEGPEVPEAIPEVARDLSGQDSVTAESQPHSADTAATAAENPLRVLAGDEEDSIEDYMNRLLQRLRGSETPDGAPVAADDRRPPITEVVRNQPPVSAPRDSAPPVSAPPLLEDPAEYRPRSQAPEMAANLAAMRALANDSARSAIVAHRHRSSYKRSLMRMFGALAILMVAGVLTFHFRDNPKGVNLGLAVSLCAGGFGLWQLISFRRQVIELLSKHAPAAVVRPPMVADHQGGPDLRDEEGEFPAREETPSWPLAAGIWDELPKRD